MSSNPFAPVRKRPMTNPTTALQRATASGEEVVAILSAVQIVVLLLELRLRAHSMESATKGPGVMRSLVDDVRELYDASLQLGNIVIRAVASGRAHLAILPTGAGHECDLEPELAAMVTASRTLLDMFDAAEATIRETRKNSQDNVDLLIETALRHDPGPALSAAVTQLIARFRAGPAVG